KIETTTCTFTTPIETEVTERSKVKVTAVSSAKLRWRTMFRWYWLETMVCSKG
ncbi:hypothetical protein ElyMa_000217100, partial [Elysia marginata]